MTPQVILISGPSGAGKTSLVKALQEELLPAVWLSFSVDSIIYGLPDSTLNRCNLHNDWSGVDGGALYRGAFACLRALVDSGNNVIFDIVLTGQKRADALMEQLAGVEVTTIALECSWDEIERRTLARGDRTVQEAKLSFDKSRPFLKYDFRIDTTATDSVLIARELRPQLLALAPNQLSESPTPRVTYSAVTAADFEELAELRIAAMRDSLERVGRFDPERARERLRKSFHPEHTEFVVIDGQHIGFYTFRPAADGFHLDHLYIRPDRQSGGVGSHVIRRLLSRSDACGMPVHLGALRDSPSNRFYLRHGFVQTAEDEWDIYYVRTPQSARINPGVPTTSSNG